MRIMVYSSAITFGGHELMSLKGLDALLAMGHSLDIVCCRNNKVLVRSVQAIADNYPGQCRLFLQRFHMRSLQIIRTWVGLVLGVKLYMLIRTLYPDRILVLQGDIEQGSEIVIPAYLASVPIVSYIPMIMKGKDRQIKLFRVRDFLSRPIYKLVTRFIVIAEFFKEQAVACGANDVHVVGNCIDDEFYTKLVSRKNTRNKLGVREGECLSGFIGRISYRQKGLDRIIALVKSNPGYFSKNRVLIVGGGPDMSRLEHDLNNNGISDCFLVRPWDDNRIAYFDALDVFLCVSRFEGVPLTILEALSRGVPVISTDLPALSGKMPVIFIRQNFSSIEILDKLKAQQIRSVPDDSIPRSIGQGSQRKHFSNSFVFSVTS